VERWRDEHLGGAELAAVSPVSPSSGGAVAASVAALPAVFRVGVRIRPVNGGGRLTIDRDVIVLEPDRPTRSPSGVERIVHTDRRVAFVTARVAPPWMSTSLVVHDGAASGYAVTWLGARSRLRAALLAAGFDVEEVTTWISQRGGAGQSGLPRLAMRQSSRIGVALASAAAAVIAVLAVTRSLGFVIFAAVCAMLAVVPLLRR
jgi:hypothetical protein